MNTTITSQEPYFIDTDSITENLSGTISVNLPKVFPDVSPTEIAHPHKYDIKDGEYSGKSLVSINIVRYEYSLKGSVPTTTLINGGTCYLTDEGIKRLSRPTKYASHFDWEIEAEE